LLDTGCKHSYINFFLPASPAFAGALIFYLTL
jgi:hypothetical protein